MIKPGKSRFVVLIICMICGNGMAQSDYLKQPLPLVQYDKNVEGPLNAIELKQLKEVYGDQLNNYVLSRPNFLKAVKDILRNRVEIIELSDPKDQKECTLLSQVPVLSAFVSDLKRDQFFDRSTFNPLKYNFRFFNRGASMYRVDNTNYFILVKSQHHR